MCVDQRQQRIPIAVDIGDQDRLLVAAELRPGELLDQLLQRADAAGQGDEGVGALEHRALALMHVARDDKLLGEPPWTSRAWSGIPGMMPVDLAAVLEHGVGERAHQADRAAAIDEPDAVFGKDLAEFCAASTKAGSVPGLDPQ